MPCAITAGAKVEALLVSHEVLSGLEGNSLDLLFFHCLRKPINDAPNSSLKDGCWIALHDSNL